MTADADATQAGPPESARNPSRWRHRVPLAAAAILGFLVASYLTVYQLRVIDTVWEPFFGNGSRQILNSSVARFVPVPDASLGAAAYLAEIALCLVGGADRWRRRPWVVVLYGVVVAGLGIGSLILVILQGAVFHAWCTGCLASAAISLALVGPGLIEPLASLREIRRSRRERDRGEARPGTQRGTPAHGG